MKIKIVGENHVFPWKLNEEIDAQISYLEDRMHQIMVGDQKYIFEASKVMFLSNLKILAEGFLTDNASVGKVAFEFNYEQ
jgi:hypothetical protein